MAALIPRRTATICLAGAVLILVVATVTGHATAGIGIAAGMAIGAGNGLLAERLFATGAPIAVTSLFRLTVLTASALLVAWLLGFEHAYFVIGGVALAQLVLVSTAVVALTSKSFSSPSPGRTVSQPALGRTADSE